MARRLLVITVLALASLGGLARGDLVPGNHFVVHFNGSIQPRRLPRRGTVPIDLSFDARIAPNRGHKTPQLRQISIAVNRHGRFDPGVLPRCSVSQLQPTTTADALRACRSSLVGRGRFTAKVILPQSSPFPSDGALYAFNGTYRGHPAILAHVYGTKPLPTSYTIPFVISGGKGEFGTVLRASLPEFTSEWGHVTGISLQLGAARGRGADRRGYLEAGCPAPPGTNVVPFKLARASFAFSGSGHALTSTLDRSCRATG